MRRRIVVGGPPLQRALPAATCGWERSADYNPLATPFNVGTQFLPALVH